LLARHQRFHRVRVRLSPNWTIHAVEIEGDLRAVFYLEADLVVTVDIGTHAIYRG
jgi:hypothetical protein